MLQKKFDIIKGPYNYNYIKVLYSAPYNGGRERFTEK